MNTRFAALAFMWPFIRPHRRRLALAMLGLALAAAAMLAIGEGLKRVIDQGFAAGRAGELDTILLVMAALALAQGVGVYIRFSNIAWVNQRVVNDIRQTLYAHLMQLSPAFFERERVGDVLSRLSSDTAVLDSVISNAFSWALRNIVMMLGAMVMLAITSVKLLALVLLATPIIIAPVVLLGRRVQKLAKASQDRLADAMARGDETIHATRTVQAYAREAFEVNKFRQRIEALFIESFDREHTSALLTALVMVLAFTGVSLILWVGGHDVLAGRMTAGQLSAFVFYAVIVAGAVGAVAEVFGQLKRASGATARIRELLATASEITAPAEPVSMPSARGELAFVNVYFRYPTRPDSAALTDFSLHVSPGEVVALVGPSGAGKSTVFQLLLRYYDVEHGCVTVDGVDVRRVVPQALRARIAFVSQDPVIFSGTVADNVRYGRLDASDDEVRAACDRAHVTEFARDLPRGFETELGERGVRLSGGQRQRVAIARAILADRPILLLDEATSSLDSESETLVTDALEKLARESGRRTTLIIAHRLSTVQNADRIVLIDRGRVLAHGRHAELMASSELYHRLASLQLAPRTESTRADGGEPG
jgi:ATP-binding cassette subfamily B protein